MIITETNLDGLFDSPPDSNNYYVDIEAYTNVRK